LYSQGTTFEAQEKPTMPLYGGIDLHANTSMVVFLNEQDQVI
jgi:hypothetical protein